MLHHVERLKHFHALQVQVSDDLWLGSEHILSCQFNREAQILQRKRIVALQVVKFAQISCQILIMWIQLKRLCIGLNCLADFLLLFLNMS